MPQRPDRADEASRVQPGVGGRRRRQWSTVADFTEPWADVLSGLLGVLNRCSGHPVTSVTPL